MPERLGWGGGSHWNTFLIFLIFVQFEVKLRQSNIKYKFCNIYNINFENMLTLLLMSSFLEGHIKQLVRGRANVNFRQK